MIDHYRTRIRHFTVIVHTCGKEHTHTTTCTYTHNHTLIHHIFSCVACKSELRPVCRSEASVPINTASEANVQNTDRRETAVWGDRRGEEGEGEYLCRYLVYLTPSPVNVTGCYSSRESPLEGDVAIKTTSLTEADASGDTKGIFGI